MFLSLHKMVGILVVKWSLKFLCTGVPGILVLAYKMFSIREASIASAGIKVNCAVLGLRDSIRLIFICEPPWTGFQFATCLDLEEKQ